MFDMYLRLALYRIENGAIPPRAKAGGFLAPSLNLPSEFVRDSAFPFAPNDNLIVKIEGKKIVIEKEE